MSAVSSLFGNDIEASEEVENEVVDQVMEEAPETIDDEVEEVIEENETSNDMIEPDTEAETEVAETTEDATEKPRQTAPVGAIQAERKKRQEAERKAAEYQKEIESLRKADREANRSDDPYIDSVNERFEQRLFNERLFDSDERAREKHGVEAVAEAAEWAKARMAEDATLRDQFLNSRKPIEFLVDQYQRDQKVTEMLTDEEAYIRRRAVELGFIANADHSAASVEVYDETPAPVIKKTAAKPLPKRGLAGAQSQGRSTDTLTGRNSAVSSLFSKR